VGVGDKVPVLFLAPPEGHNLWGRTHHHFRCCCNHPPRSRLHHPQLHSQNRPPCQPYCLCSCNCTSRKLSHEQRGGATSSLPSHNRTMASQQPHIEHRQASDTKSNARRDEYLLCGRWESEQGGQVISRVLGIPLAQLSLWYDPFCGTSLH